MNNEVYQLGELEELILMIVAILQDQAYGVRVMDEIESQTGRKVNISGVHTTLDRLEKKNLLSSEMGGANAERGGRRKRIFSITAQGGKALQFVHDTRNQLYNQIPKAIFSFG